MPNPDPDTDPESILLTWLTTVDVSGGSRSPTVIDRSECFARLSHLQKYFAELWSATPEPLQEKLLQSIRRSDSFRVVFGLLHSVGDAMSETALSIRNYSRLKKMYFEYAPIYHDREHGWVDRLIKS